VSLFQCQECGCCENTACGWYWYTKHDDPKYNDRKLCSACGPATFSDGTKNDKCGEWHGRFERTYYPLNSMETDSSGNLKKKAASK
jgi:hypothetical protein